MVQDGTQKPRRQRKRELVVSLESARLGSGFDCGGRHPHVC